MNSSKNKLNSKISWQKLFLPKEPLICFVLDSNLQPMRYLQPIIFAKRPMRYFLLDQLGMTELATSNYS